MSKFSAVNGSLCSSFRPPFCGIGSLLQSERPPEAVVSSSRGKSLSWAEFRAEVTGLCSLLRSRKEESWLLASKSSYRFALGFFALLHSDKSIVLPAKCEAASLLELRSESEAFLCDTPKESCDVNLQENFSLEPREFSAVDSQSARIALFTSGSTGERKKIIKSLHNFDTELRVLEQLWGAEIANAAVVSTVSHQHIYGLLYKVLWPLAAGRVFCEETLLYPSEVLKAASAFERTCLISSPAYLKRAVVDSSSKTLSKKISAIFSSGSPLDRGSAQQWFSLCGKYPTEVLGSTESGGVAWREQDCENPLAHWRLLPEVQLKTGLEQGELEIRSAFVGPAAKPTWYTMADLVRVLDEKTFEHLGRADRLIKVEDKRFSPAEMEQLLESNSLVDEAAVLSVDKAASRAAAKRSAVAVLLSPSEHGLELLRVSGESRLRNELRLLLTEHFEALTLPKYWRFVSAIPKDAQGKKNLFELQKFFRPLEGEVSAFASAGLIAKSAERAVVSLRIPKALPHFAGHFREHPLVPGFLQISWLVGAAEKYFEFAPELLSLSKLKFKRMLFPESEIELHLHYRREQKELVFEIKSLGFSCSSGVAKFR